MQHILANLHLPTYLPTYVSTKIYITCSLHSTPVRTSTLINNKATMIGHNLITMFSVLKEVWHL